MQLAPQERDPVLELVADLPEERAEQQRRALARRTRSARSVSRARGADVRPRAGAVRPGTVPGLHGRRSRRWLWSVRILFFTRAAHGAPALRGSLRRARRTRATRSSSAGRADGDSRTLPKRLRNAGRPPRGLRRGGHDPSAATRSPCSATRATTSGTCGPSSGSAPFNRRRALDGSSDSATARTRERRSRPGPTRSLALDEDVRLALDAHARRAGGAASRPTRACSRSSGARSRTPCSSRPLSRQRSTRPRSVKAARELGIPCGFLVYSWDNLSNKGRIHVPPDRVYVWNDLQRREAVELHGIDPERDRRHRRAALGRVLRDDAVGRRASEFCAAARVRPRPADRPLPRLHERRLPGRDRRSSSAGWTRSAAPAPLGDANVLIRRHPGEPTRWVDGWTPPGERVSLSDRAAHGRPDLYDELHHAAAAVGLNTSAQIEASILGKPVYTFSAGRRRAGPGGLAPLLLPARREHGGVVQYSRDARRARRAARARPRRRRRPRRRSARSARRSSARTASIGRSRPQLADEIAELARARG